MNSNRFERGRNATNPKLNAKFSYSKFKSDLALWAVTLGNRMTKSLKLDPAVLKERGALNKGYRCRPMIVVSLLLSRISCLDVFRSIQYLGRALVPHISWQPSLVQPLLCDWVGCRRWVSNIASILSWNLTLRSCINYQLLSQRVLIGSPWHHTVRGLVGRLFLRQHLSSPSVKWLYPLPLCGSFIKYHDILISHK